MGSFGANFGANFGGFASIPIIVIPSKKLIADLCVKTSVRKDLCV